MIEKLIYQFLALIFCATTSAFCCADDVVNIGVDSSIQPFVLPHTKSGLLVEIMSKAYATQNTKTRFVFLPEGRIWPAFENNGIDVATMEKTDDHQNIIYSHWPVLSFKNTVISLKSKHLEISSIADLSKLSIITFFNARKYLGDEFETIAKSNPHYHEQVEMPSKMLNVGRADVFIAQADIFRYNLVNENREFPTLELDSYDYKHLFDKPNQYWFAFKTAEMRDKFERGIAAIYLNGEIEKLFSEYNERFGTSREMFITLDCMFLKKKPSKCSSK